MFIADDFIYVHVPRTAGTFTNKLLRDIYPLGCSMNHFSRPSWLPGKYDGYPVHGFIRNPWDWYVSWAAHNDSLVLFNEFLVGRIGEYGEFLARTIDERTIIHRYENLIPELSLITGESVSELERRPVLNHKVHKNYRDYYTPRFIELVREVESKIIEKYGYKFN
ncbi:MAG: hypothetical protein ACC707_16295 [Thiohalomonadales bacterium]